MDLPLKVTMALRSGILTVSSTVRKPAIEYATGDKSWYLNGKLHREDGPAVEHIDGRKRWYLNGKSITEQEHKKATTKATCDGKEVEIDGVTYILKEKQNG